MGRARRGGIVIVEREYDRPYSIAVSLLSRWSRQNFDVRVIWETYGKKAERN